MSSVEETRRVRQLHLEMANIHSLWLELLRRFGVMPTDHLTFDDHDDDTQALQTLYERHTALVDQAFERGLDGYEIVNLIFEAQQAWQPAEAYRRVADIDAELAAGLWKAAKASLDVRLSTPEEALALVRYRRGDGQAAFH